jgi:hypothetical protein
VSCDMIGDAASYDYTGITLMPLSSSLVVCGEA